MVRKTIVRFLFVISFGGVVAALAGCGNQGVVKVEVVEPTTAVTTTTTSPTGTLHGTCTLGTQADNDKVYIYRLTVTNTGSATQTLDGWGVYVNPTGVAPLGLADGNAAVDQGNLSLPNGDNEELIPAGSTYTVTQDPGSYDASVLSDETESGWSNLAGDECYVAYLR